MSTTREGWKVVRVGANGVYISVFRHRSIGGVVYEIGKKTYPLPGHGPLTLLRSLKAARKFLSTFHSGNAIFLKCRYRPSKKRRVWNLHTSETVSRLEKDNNEILLPGHTVLADWIKLTGGK